MPTISTGEVDLHYRFDGEGATTVVLINGLADDLTTWDPQVPDLVGAGYRVLRFDNRGVGRSGKPPGPYSCAQMAVDVERLLDVLHVRDFHLVGLSMGGMVAQECALRLGSDLRSLVLACTYAEPGAFCSRLFSLWHDMAETMGLSTVMRDVNLWAFTLNVFTEEPEWFLKLERDLETIAQPLHAYQAQLAAIRAHDASHKVGQIEAPTLVIAAEQDILIPVALSRRLHRLIPGSRFAIVPGGHACSCERPDDFNRELLRFLKARH